MSYSDFNDDDQYSTSRRSNFPRLSDQPKIILAILDNNIGELKKLIKNGEELTTTDNRKRSPLHLAAAIGADEIVKILLQAGVRVNIRDSDCLTPLHRACRSNQENVVVILLKNGAEANAKDKNWVTPLHICAANNALECAKELLPHLNNVVDTTDRSGATALHHAVFNINCDLITFLLANKCNPNAVDKQECRPLHYAAAVDSTDGIRFLIINGKAEINPRDKDLMSPLHIAAAKGCANAVQLLLELGADVNCIDSFGNTPLHWAALEGQEEVMDELINHGAEINITNKVGFTSIHYAAASTEGAVCHDILLTCKNININATDHYGRTPLHLAAHYGRINRVMDLVRCGANINAFDKQHRTPLHCASGQGRTAVIDTLKSLEGIDVNLRDLDGMTPLHYSAFSGVTNCCELLLSANANPQICDTAGRTPHFLAAFSGNLDCLKIFNSMSEKSNDASNRTMFHYAASSQRADPGCLQFLFSNLDQTDINQRDTYGRTALHYASTVDKDGDFVELLLKFGARADIPDFEGYLPIHYAAAFGQLQVLKSLLFSTSWRRIPLITCPSLSASYHGHKECLQLLLQYGFHDEISRALEYAIFQRHSDCIQVIFDFVKNNSKVSFEFLNRSLYIASLTAFHEGLLVLLDHADCIDLRDEQGRTPLMLASMSNSSSGYICVDLLLKRLANPNNTDHCGRSPLFYAAFGGSEQSAKFLIRYGANIVQRDILGKTALHIAVSLGHANVLRELIAHLAVVNHECVVDNENLTPLHWAAIKSQPECVTCLLNTYGSKQFYGSKTTPLHYAAFFGGDRCLSLLITHFGNGAVHLKDSKQRTVLHYACMAKKENIRVINLVITASKEPDVNKADQYGVTPFMYAAKNGHDNVVQTLLDKGADGTKVDHKGNTALHFACRNKHENIAINIFENFRTLVNTKDGDFRTPLHLCSGNGMIQMTQLLLTAGASVSATDVDGLTPSLSCAKNANVADCLNLIETIMIFEEQQKYSQNEIDNFSTTLGSRESRESIIKRKSAQMFCDQGLQVQTNGINDDHLSSDSDVY